MCQKNLVAFFLVDNDGCIFFYLSFLDTRVKDYPLMKDPLHMTSILLIYVVLCVHIGPRLMANRKPFRLNTAMIIYNLSMVLLNANIVYEVNKIDNLLGCFLTVIHQSVCEK